MNFTLWLENIESLDDMIKQIQDIINNNNYENAIKLLKSKFQFEYSPSNSLAQKGRQFANQFYEVLSGKKKERSSDPKLDEQLKQLANKIQNELNLKLKEIDWNNPWYNFDVIQTNGDNAGKKAKISDQKLHFKVLPDNLNQVFQIAQIINNNRSRFHEFKMSQSSESFAGRRDNMVAYLSIDGAQDLDNTRKLFGNIQHEVGKDFYWKDATGKLYPTSHTETKSLDLALLLLQKHPDYDGNPSNNKYGFYPREKAYLLQKAETPTTKTPPSTQPTVEKGKILITPKQGKPTVLALNAIMGALTWPSNQKQFLAQQQFQLNKVGNNWQIVPLPAKNATFLNDQPINKPTLLQNGDVIAVGNPETKRTVAHATINL